MTMITERELKQRQARAAKAAKEARRRRVMRNRRILAGVLAIMVALVIGLVASQIKNTRAEETEVSVSADTEPSEILIRISHEVKGGENLSVIARKYIEQYGSSDNEETVVARIISYNGLNASEANYHLQAGDKIVVPIFIPEDRNPHHVDPNYDCLKESQN